MSLFRTGPHHFDIQAQSLKFFHKHIKGFRQSRLEHFFTLNDRLIHAVTSGDIIRVIAAVLLPPLGVFLQVGLGLHFWLNILLTLLGYIPGIVHAIWIIARR